MKTYVRFASLFLLTATFAILGQGAAMAGNTVVYNNGAPDFNDAWTINYGFSVDDSFTLAQAGNLTQIKFAAALFPGDTLQSVQWTIYAATCPVAGRRPIVYSGTSNTASVGSCGFECEEESFSLPNLNLPAGTYYLRLQNAVVASGNPVYWWESGGPSIAYENALAGTIPSESFEVIDPPVVDTSSTGGASPAPNSLALYGPGALGLAGLAWRLAKLL